ncbi:hypothetical protein [Streptomyces tubercidicus]|uniref:hypothetical protein n=1 Tax=Streptomyces tubercidicus TaxID=47759 RepID=UPI0036C30533
MARTTLRAAFLRIIRVWDDAVRAGRMRPQTAESYIATGERLLRYTTALGVSRLDDVTDTVAQGFTDSPGRDRHGNITPVPADSTRRLRKSGVDALFTEARRLGLTAKAPLLDLPPIPRSARRPVGSLTDDDIDNLRFHAECGMPQTRHAAVLALLLSGLHTGEIGWTSTADIDHTHARVWAAGAARITARYCPLDDPWCQDVLDQRVRHLLKHSAPSGPPPALAITADAPAHRRQSSVCTAFGEIVLHSGTKPDGRSARPRDVTGWLAAKIFAESGQIADVALLLGLSTLDGAARLAGYDWRPAQGEAPA